MRGRGPEVVKSPLRMRFDVVAEQVVHCFGVFVPLLGQLAEVPDDVFTGALGGRAAEQFTALARVFDIGEVLADVGHGITFLVVLPGVPRPGRGYAREGGVPPEEPSEPGQPGKGGDPGEQPGHVVPDLTGMRAVQYVQGAGHGPGQAPA